MDSNLERNCNTTLQNFVEVLQWKATEFNESIAELNRMVGRIENLSPKLTVLENIEENEENEIRLYSIEMIDKIVSLILFELNDCVNRAHDLIRKIGKSLDVLYKSNQEFTSTANAVRMLEHTSIVKGRHNRKPLNYYTEESCTRLHAWKRFHYELDAVWRNLDVRDLKTIEMVKGTQRTPLKCQELMDEYLLYCSMITSNKRNK